MHKLGGGAGQGCPAPFFSTAARAMNCNDSPRAMAATLRRALWIGDKKRNSSGGQPCPYLRTLCRINGEVKSAVLHWTALGLAEVRINATKVGDAMLAPGWSDFRKRVQVMSCDVTGLLRPGPNRLGAIIADGWYCGTLGWNGQRNHYGTHPQFLAVLRIELAHGDTITIQTGPDWEMRSGAVLESDIYHGETHDARRETPGWCLPSERSKGWHPVHVFPPYEGLLELKVNEPTRVTETVTARQVTEPAPGRFVFDFGQNLTGVCRLRVQARRGKILTLRFAEMLNRDGTLYRENLRTARATDRYICSGRGVEEWTPRFTFHGFRYVEIEGLGKRPKPDTLQALVLHTDMRPTGSFRCSNADVNQLNQNIRWGLRGNFLDVPTDCPQRDERLGWTGDAQVFMGTAAFHYDIRAFFHKWMRDLVDGQREDGAFPDVAPALLPWFGNAAWADAGIICPWKIFWHYGDRSILRQFYPAMARWIGYQEATSASLLRPITSYGDWLAIDAVTPPHAPVPSDLVGTAYFAHTTALMARVAAILGKREDAVRFRTLHARIVKAFQNAYVTPSGRVVGHCQTGYLLALAFDLLPSAVRPKALGFLVDLLQARDWHLTTGFVGTPLLCPVLSRFGRTDIAYKLLLQDTYPSWLYPIRNGATTMWERWNSYTEAEGFGPVGMNSFNHYAYGAIGEWIYGVVGGIRPLAPGYRSILFAPEPGDGITSARTVLDAPTGRIACHWQTRRHLLTISVKVPQGSQARIRVPRSHSPSHPLPSVIEAGTHRFEAEAVSV